MRASRAQSRNQLPFSLDLVVSTLARSPIFSRLSTEQLRSVVSDSRSVTLNRQAQIFEEGTRSLGMWVVAWGKVRLQRYGVEGRQHILGFRGAGAILEMSSGIDGRAHMSSATTVEPTHLLLIPRSELQEICRLIPNAMQIALDQLCLEVRQRDIALTVAVMKDGKARIACLLLRMAREFGVGDKGALSIGTRLTRSDIAGCSGIALETASRIMARLERLDILRTQAQVVHINDLSRLADVAGCDDCPLDCSVFNSGIFTRPSDTEDFATEPLAL